MRKNRIVIRTLFGDVEKNNRLRAMVDCATDNENSLREKNPNAEPIYYFILGNNNAQYLKNKGMKNIITISDKIDARPIPEIPIYYNKTFLALKAFDKFGSNAEVLLLDMDVRLYKLPDKKMWNLYAIKANNIAHFQSPLRQGYRHDQRIPINPSNESDNGIVRNMLINSCVIYCNDQNMWGEYLETYEKVHLKLKNQPGIIGHQKEAGKKSF